MRIPELHAKIREEPVPKTNRGSREEQMFFRRKIYDKLKNWKTDTNGTKALFIEGARRIGKSTIVEAFAKKEYKSYILIDFNDASNVPH